MQPNARSLARAAILVLVLVLPAASCLDSGSRGGGGGGGGAPNLGGGGGGGAPAGPITKDNLCEHLLEAIVDSVANCAARDEIDMEELRAYFGDDCSRNLVAGVEAGVITIDAGQLSDCVAGLRRICFRDSVAMNADPAVRQACKDALAGALEEGGDCYNSNECKGGTCDRWSAGELNCPGRCIEDAEPGESCDDGRNCTSGYFCHQDLCRVKRDAGEECGAGGDECGSGLVCHWDSEALDAGECGRQRAKGEACSSRRQCITQYCSPDDKCDDHPAAGVAGDPCGSRRSCHYDLWCRRPKDAPRGSEGTCAPKAEPGAACPVGGEDIDWFGRGCEDSLCKADPGADEGICAKTERGDPCVQGACTGDLDCDWDEDRCVEGESTGCQRE